MHVTVYTKPGCHLCDDALFAIDRLARRYDLEVAEANILDDPALYEEYKHIIPVVEVTDVQIGRLVAPIAEAELTAYFTLAQQTIESARRGGPSTPNLAPYALAAQPAASVLPAPDVKEPWIDRAASYAGKHWLKMLVVAMGFFVGLPWLAPVFAALGWWGPANALYTAFALTCHQLPERAGSVFGYQVAFCYRNTALYGGVFLFGILYGLARDRDIPWLRWLRSPLPWWGLVLFVTPMAIDGLTHMFGLREAFDWTMDSSFGSFYIGSQPWGLNWWLRILTGALAALGGVWFAFPKMQRAVEESEALRLMYRQSAMIAAQRARAKAQAQAGQPAAN
jgi:uncharacterized membrane protein/glutaredoxin